MSFSICQDAFVLGIYSLLVCFLNGAEFSVNSANSGNLINH